MELLVAVAVGSLLMGGLAVAFANVHDLYGKSMRTTPLAVARESFEGARAQLNSAGEIVYPPLEPGRLASEAVVVETLDSPGWPKRYFAVCVSEAGELVARRLAAFSLPPELTQCKTLRPADGWAALFPADLQIRRLGGSRPVFTRAEDRNRIDLEAKVAWVGQEGAIDTWKASFVIEGALR